jgi:N utilization substance protein B
MSNRHHAREVALQILYRYDVALQGKNANPVTIGESKLVLNAPAKTLTPADLDRAVDLKSHFEHFKVAPDVREFAATLVSGTLRELAALDETLERQASNWKVSRMALVDRSLLRMALYEMLHLPESPDAVVIDEAVELAKQYGNAESPGFINGILDAIKKSKT